MKTVSSIVLIGAVLVGSALYGCAQEVTGASVAAPCPEEQTPGRPTLRRRQGTSASGASVEIAKNSDAERCQPKDVAGPAVSLQKVPLRFEGLFNVDESDLRHYIRTHEVNETSAGSYLSSVGKLVTLFLQTAGYRHAKVTLQSETLGAEAVFVIDQGPRPPIVEYRFEGNRVFSTARLADELVQCMAGYDRDYYDTEVFAYCSHQLHVYAASRGYLKAQFHDPKVTETAGGLIISLSVDEGIRYRLGDVTFDGDLLRPAGRLETLFPIKKGEILKGELLSTWLFQELKRTYNELGYIQYTADVTPQYRSTPAGDGIADLAITIDAGKLFKVRRITFAGEQLPNNLTDLMLIHDGDIYNQALFERSVETLNNTGLFEFIDKDKDTDFRPNEEEGLLDIEIKLTRKNG